MAYEYPTEVNFINGIGNLFVYINEVTNNWFGRMMIISVFILVFVGFLRARTSEDDFIGAFAVASYITFVISLLLFIVNILDPVSFGVTIALSIISTTILLLDKRGE